MKTHVYTIIIICTIVTITKIEGTLDILDNNPMMYAFELIEYVYKCMYIYSKV